MRNRWSILALLFLVRSTMALQFQSVAAVAPLMTARYGLELADIGLLIGLYFAPGTALALPGGALGRWLGDKRAALAGLALMLTGGLLVLAATSWSGQLAGRLIAGTGGVLLNVLMTKMVADWFAGRELSTAMAIFVNSWPAGIAVGLLVLPGIGSAFGLQAVNLVVALLVVAAILSLAAFYAPAETAGAASPAQGTMPDRETVGAVMLAGLLWALYNVGLAMVFSFGPVILAARGWSMPEAGATISIMLWLMVFVLPLGGFLADYFKRGDLILTAGCLIFAALLYATARSASVLLLVLALGLFAGLPAGPIMTLPAQVLQPATRAFGMGIFYTIFYAGMLIGPSLGGRYASWTGSAAGAFDFGAVAVLLCPLCLVLFRRITRGGLPTATPMRSQRP